ncbi:hypothetical protein [Pseudomonas leptonychotis]|uniref:hypothetical protein n=1 Tax=Pseudomonas leptonychotis TaxID=2448482 RepID=UPI00386758D2
MASIDDNINSLFDFANSALSSARSAEGRIASFTPNISSGNLQFTPGNMRMPQPASLTDLLSPDNSSATLQFLKSEGEAWLDTYFPEMQACLRSTPEEWLCGILTGQKPFGLSKEVFEAVWHEGRDREYRARNSAVEQLRSEFSARGFPVPPGAMIKAISRIEERASDAIGEVNRAQMTRDAEIKLDLLKFAEEQAIRLKLGIMQSMADFYRQWVELPNKDLEASRIRTQAYATFQDSMSSYWRVQLGFEDLRLQAASLRMNGKLDESRIKVAAMDGSRNAALGNAVQAYANTAAASSSAASTLNGNLLSGSV